MRPASAPPAVQAPAPYAGEEYREPSVLVKWFRSNREPVVIIGFLLYEVVAFRTARAASRRAPRLRRLALVWAAVALVAAAVVGFYLPTQVPGTMWEGFFRAILYVAAGAIVLVVLPVLLAAVIPRRRGGPTGG